VSANYGTVDGKRTCKNGDVAAPPLSKLLRRNVFTTSRLAEFSSKEELTRLIGHEPRAWLIAALKELVDNGLDAAERQGVAPAIDIAIGDGFLSVSDNGPGIASETIERILDYSFRTSSNAAYVSPTRGQQGNALQTLLAMAHALSGEPGIVTIDSRGVRHWITFDVDPISREPRPEHRKDSTVAPGTTVTLNWPLSLDEATLVHLHDAAHHFSWANPHVNLSFTALLAGADVDLNFYDERTIADWRKWTPSDPTSAHWYDLQSLKTLMAAEINKARLAGSAQRTVADFIADFRGLSGTAKRRDICEAVGASRESLEAFYVRGDGVIASLLGEMKAASKPVKARDLGIIGEDHVLEMIDGEPATQHYKRVEVEVDGVPYLIECGFGYQPPDTNRRMMVAGLNWSISVAGNPFSRLGPYGDGLGAILEHQRAGPCEPIAFFLHVATPRPAFLDKGKSVVRLPREVEAPIKDAARQVTDDWAKQRKREEKEANATLKRMDALTKPAKPMSIKDAAFSVMAQAYAKASGNAAWWADARQIYYAARGDILRLARIDKLDSDYFTQNLLVEYINSRRDECATWRVAFDPRGHLVEPHTGKKIGLGTRWRWDDRALFRMT
jgi:hypothetical protein